MAAAAAWMAGGGARCTHLPWAGRGPGAAGWLLWSRLWAMLRAAPTPEHMEAIDARECRDQ
jgi:hypothetical protein